ncbi:MAG: DUF1501 domain-containing protein [Planctomycetota bacterium]|nr:MAG: DUF1501 domain-containing protein [Planctomycetota bacterium]REJ96212.1 MAG: DUF1501 domain-containing protein [Planctomycetota bacterium]REK21573.1 MAG: DUF1501 domain-containing protein [Planctomycetota bacterium]REK39874.1 MAG: DUF1501 domain-containing protein [Planctomycetota bacterium]
MSNRRISDTEFRMNRRTAVRIGGAGLLGGLTLPRLLELQSTAAAPQPAKAKSCIFFMLEGGPSHIDMWDLKPGAPAEIRGPYQPISTAVAGTQIGELLPMTAGIVDKFTILRSHSHADNAHQTGRHWVLTGYPPSFADGQAQGMPFNALYPSIGSIVARELGQRGAVPPYVEMPNPLGPGGPGFYGAKYAPFTIDNDPVQADFKVRDLTTTSEVDGDRYERRKQLLQDAEALGASDDATGPAKQMTDFYEQAMTLVSSPEASRAFDLSVESDEMRERYGYTSIGQCALLGRRLVEADCRFVGITHGSWDTHVDNFTSHEKTLVPPTDRALTTLLTDLDDRGLLDETLVVVMGEMGRTPRINKDAGRDHWSMCQSVILAGGGIKRGAVIGASDETASYPTTQPYGIHDLLQTLFYLMGVDANKIHHTPLGRPVPIVSGGHRIDEVLA